MLDFLHLQLDDYNTYNMTVNQLVWLACVILTLTERASNVCFRQTCFQRTEAFSALVYENTLYKSSMFYLLPQLTNQMKLLHIFTTDLLNILSWTDTLCHFGDWCKMPAHHFHLAATQELVEKQLNLKYLKPNRQRKVARSSEYRLLSGACI